MPTPQAIFVYQEFSPHQVDHKTLGKTSLSDVFDRTFGWTSEDEELGGRRHAVPETLAGNILMVLSSPKSLEGREFNPDFYYLQNLPLRGTDPLLSFEGNHAAYLQSVGFLRLPLFEHQFRSLKKAYQELIDAGARLAEAGIRTFPQISNIHPQLL